MLAKTSSEAYNEYQRLRRVEEKLEKENRGLNIINADKFFKPERFCIEIKKVSKVNLMRTSSKIVINTDFPFANWSYSYGDISIEDFLQQLKEWVSTPGYKFFIQHNRKRDNKASWWELPKFKKFDIQFEDVDFDIGKEAQHEINLMGFDFIEEVKKLLSQQREATEKEAEDFERFRFLLEEIDNLKRQLAKPNGYYYSQRKDETFKIIIDKKSYNTKLGKVGQELKKLCEKYSFLKMPSLSYQKIIKKLSFEDWKAENEVEAEDEWSNFDDDDKEEHDGDFEGFLKWCYEHYLEHSDFDE